MVRNDRAGSSPARGTKAIRERENKRMDILFILKKLSYYVHSAVLSLIQPYSCVDIIKLIFHLGS